jgi:hypothetical protein
VVKIFASRGETSMRRKLVLSAVSVGVVAAFLVAPAANAKPVLGNSLGLRPSVGLHPGDSVEVFGICNEPGFSRRKLESQVLDPTEVSRNVGDGEAPSLSGHAQVRKDAKPGRYTVSLRCEGALVSHTIVIVSGQKHPASPKPTPSGQVKVKPKGAANTGGGDGPVYIGH